MKISKDVDATPAQGGWISLDSMNNATNEKRQLVQNGPRRLTAEKAPRYRAITLAVTWSSIVSTTTLGTLALVFSFKDTSSSTFAFGFFITSLLMKSLTTPKLDNLDAILDTLSSLVVAWRYTGPDENIYSARKERIACVVIAILFVISSLAVMVRSVFSMVYVLLPTQESLLWKLAITNGTISAVFMGLKSYLGYMMESRAILTDAFNSLIGTIMGFGCAVSVFVFLSNPRVWYLDGALGIVCSLLLLSYGLWLLLETCRKTPEEAATKK